MVSCSRVEHSVDFTTAVKKVLNVSLSHYRHILSVYYAGLSFRNPRDYFRNGHFSGLEMCIQPHGCSGFLQFPVTPPSLRISRAQSTRRAAIFTVMDRKKCVSLTRKFRVACEKSPFVFWELDLSESSNTTVWNEGPVFICSIKEKYRSFYLKYQQ